MKEKIICVMEKQLVRGNKELQATFQEISSTLVISTDMSAFAGKYEVIQHSEDSYMQDYLVSFDEVQYLFRTHVLAHAIKEAVRTKNKNVTVNAALFFDEIQQKIIECAIEDEARSALFTLEKELCLDVCSSYFRKRFLFCEKEIVLKFSFPDASPRAKVEFIKKFDFVAAQREAEKKYCEELKNELAEARKTIANLRSEIKDLERSDEEVTA